METKIVTSKIRLFSLKWYCLESVDQTNENRKQICIDWEYKWNRNGTDFVFSRIDNNCTHLKCKIEENKKETAPKEIVVLRLPFFLAFCVSLVSLGWMRNQNESTIQLIHTEYIRLLLYLPLFTRPRHTNYIMIRHLRFWQVLSKLKVSKSKQSFFVVLFWSAV